MRFEVYDRNLKRHVIVNSADHVSALAEARERKDWTPGRASPNDPALFIDLRSHHGQ